MHVSGCLSSGNSVQLQQPCAAVRYHTLPIECFLIQRVSQLPPTTETILFVAGPGACQSNAAEHTLPSWSLIIGLLLWLLPSKRVLFRSWECVMYAGFRTGVRQGVSYKWIPRRPVPLNSQLIC